MEKLFDERNEEKKELDSNQLQIFAKPRDVCYIKLGVNVGFEENGKDGFMRPVLVISKI